jgi:hypothetical protein
MSLDRNTADKLTIRKFPLDSQGYTKADGDYRGTPNNVWRISNEDGDWYEVRAGDLAAAKRKAMILYPKAQWGKGMKNLVDAATKNLADAVGSLKLSEELLANRHKTNPEEYMIRHYENQIKRYRNEVIPKMEQALLKAQKAQRGEYAFGEER